MKETTIEIVLSVRERDADWNIKGGSATDLVVVDIAEFNKATDIMEWNRKKTSLARRQWLLAKLVLETRNLTGKTE